MVTFLLILGVLITFNFILLKFSIQSVDTDKNEIKSKSVHTTTTNKITAEKTSDIPKAA